MSVMALSGLFSVYVGNIDKLTTTIELEQMFSKFGNPRKLYIADRPAQSKFTYGFVRFVFKDSAMKAVLEMNGRMYKGKRLCVELSRDNRGSEELRKELKNWKGGEQKSILEQDTTDVRKLIQLKITIRDFNANPESLPIDGNTLIVELIKLKPKLPRTVADVADDFMFGAKSMLKELTDPTGGVCKRQVVIPYPPGGVCERESERMQPLACCKEIIDIPWLQKMNLATPVRSDYSIEQSTDSQKVPTGNQKDAAPTTKINSKTETDRTVLSGAASVKSASLRMPDILTGHQSVLTGGCVSNSDDSSDSTPLPPHTKESTPLPLHTKKSTPLPLHTKESTPLPPLTNESAPLPPLTKESAPLPPHTKESTPLPLHTKKSTPLPLHTKESTPMSPHTAIPSSRKILSTAVVYSEDVHQKLNISLSQGEISSSSVSSFTTSTCSMSPPSTPSTQSIRIQSISTPYVRTSLSNLESEIVKSSSMPDLELDLDSDMPHLELASSSPLPSTRKISPQISANPAGSAHQHRHDYVNGDITYNNSHREPLYHQPQQYSQQYAQQYPNTSSNCNSNTSLPKPQLSSSQIKIPPTAIIRAPHGRGRKLLETLFD